MSAIGEYAFVNLLREKLSVEIEAKKVVLITTTTERNAGRIQGLQDALGVIDELYRKLSSEDRSRPKQSG